MLSPKRANAPFNSPTKEKNEIIQKKQIEYQIIAIFARFIVHTQS